MAVLSAHRPFLTAAWRDLAVLNFEVNPSVLAPYVPAKTELDLWQGKTLVSLVGFRFLETKVLGVSVPFHTDFDEVNLRFYVRGAEGRGVVFIKEIVPKRAVAGVARLLYGENYVTAPIEHRIERGRSVSYTWQWQGRQNYVAIDAAGEPWLPAEDSAEAFILEHYWGYKHSAYRVEHPRWRVWTVTAARCDVGGDALYGAGFGEVLQAAPVSAMLAEGSEVAVFRQTGG